MFMAKVYIASASGAMKEERLAQDTVSKWNCQRGEKCGTVFVLVPHDASPDVYVIDNYVDRALVESVIATGSKVLLFFSRYHDPKNTMESEIQAIEEFRGRLKSNCECIDYNGIQAFESLFVGMLDNLAREQYN